jgi:hypothetical protein
MCAIQICCSHFRKTKHDRTHAKDLIGYLSFTNPYNVPDIDLGATLLDKGIN